ncbi:hypothetical protein BH10PAT1_BH10PAT1_0710 [soil metagenome]
MSPDRNLYHVSLEAFPAEERSEYFLGIFEDALTQLHRDGRTVKEFYKTELDSDWRRKGANFVVMNSDHNEVGFHVQGRGSMKPSQRKKLEENKISVCYIRTRQSPFNIKLPETLKEEIISKLIALQDFG